MAEFVSLKQTLRIKWKVENFFRVNSLETQINVHGSSCKLQLQRCVIGCDECFVIDMYNINMNKFLFNGLKAYVFIQDRNQKLKFPSSRTAGYNFIRIWIQYRTDLQKEEDTFLSDGCVTFVCDITSETSKDKTEREISTQTTVPIDSLACFECLSCDFHRLLDDSVLSDVTLKCGDRSIPVHKNILSARSEVFFAMLRSNMAESRTGIIEISDMEPSTLHQLVQYIYSGRVSELSVDSAQELYVAADKYAIDSLKKSCGNFMKENLTEENACTILALADVHGDKHIKDCALSVIVETDVLRDAKNWFGFHEKYPKLAAEVIHYVYTKKNFPK